MAVWNSDYSPALVADSAPFRTADGIHGDIGGVVGDALVVMGNENQFDASLKSIRVGEQVEPGFLNRMREEQMERILSLDSTGKLMRRNLSFVIYRPFLVFGIPSASEQISPWHQNC